MSSLHIPVFSQNAGPVCQFAVTCRHRNKSFVFIVYVSNKNEAIKVMVNTIKSYTFSFLLLLSVLLISSYLHLLNFITLLYST